MAHFEHVTRVIFAKVKPPIKPLVYPDPTPTKKDPLRALNVHLGRMPTSLGPYLVKNVTTMRTNLNPMLRNAFQCKKVSTNRAQQPKSNVQRVKQELVAMQHAILVRLVGFKNYQAIPRAVNVPLDLATQL